MEFMDEPSDDFFARIGGVATLIDNVKEFERYIAQGSSHSEILRKWVEDRKDWLRRNGAAW